MRAKTHNTILKVLTVGFATVTTCFLIGLFFSAIFGEYDILELDELPGNVTGNTTGLPNYYLVNGTYYRMKTHTVKAPEVSKPPPDTYSHDWWVSSFVFGLLILLLICFCISLAVGCYEDFEREENDVEIVATVKMVAETSAKDGEEEDLFEMV